MVAALPKKSYRYCIKNPTSISSLTARRDYLLVVLLDCALRALYETDSHAILKFRTSNTGISDKA